MRGIFWRDPETDEAAAAEDVASAPLHNRILDVVVTEVDGNDGKTYRSLSLQIAFRHAWATYIAACQARKGRIAAARREFRESVAAAQRKLTAALREPMPAAPSRKDWNKK